jgi:hypothetical protein
VSKEETTVFCNGDSIIWFTACDCDGFASLQPASKSTSRNIALIMVPRSVLIRNAANIDATRKRTVTPFTHCVSFYSERARVSSLFDGLAPR